MFSLANPCVCVVRFTSPHNRPPNRNFRPIQSTIFISPVTKIKAVSDGKEYSSPVTVTVQEEDEVQSTSNKEVEESVKLLKKAAKTRKVPATEILSAFKVIEKAKLDPSRFCETLGGSESPGRTWMLIFTAQKGLKSGKYFPITAVQRFDAVARRIENGVYLGALGCLTFEGRFSWKKRILAFMFELIRIKIGPFNPFEINIKGDDESEPSTKNPFFIWFYIDEEIAVARGRSGGTAFWCRCRRV
ncbi:hypothetical protein HanRHA438_Chr05g0221571 [Helianthus annuus]|uniref:Uncharacterized protein n=1 Tax=Helianthus annuus TaxID=4232 RepID=A0A251UP28_HELAN|nr:uncharacterized protein LOC110940838 isoform X1 [Helianthus annuus]KAF5805664.1 hypothetical protein HanXRQr2_Chr05g0212081 [Helianthus annuus]KAJ0570060.1 hypothetical protein HanHA300_Chr05g0173751 [Helianthus annuus]KAJ0576777.1 hypothetical protein HanIR_Chr05g0228321 [Helianthus annuus]KAJ0584390.1 hypothetical protein HanHA89_Chr05g0188041 [Helianthus annuus]KAJ0747016.1 hypothetical protein HanOQP8_Chr05g0184591 [Helianthus annuus]